MTITEIAKKLNIAISTVSKALNNAPDVSEGTKELVIKTAKELGYSPSKKIKSDRICIFVENINYQDVGQFNYEIILGFKRAALLEGYEVLIKTHEKDIDTTFNYDKEMAENQLKGALILEYIYPTIWKQLQTTTYPTVLIDNYIENGHVGYIGIDNIEALYLAVKHLKKLGHKKIAFLSAERGWLLGRERHTAFMGAMEYNELKYDPKLIEYGAFTAEAAVGPTEKFVQGGATAIICASDIIAVGVINELKRLNISVPSQMSIIGFDDLMMAKYLSPPLTTIKQDKVLLGEAAFKALLQLINDELTHKILLKPELVIRQSTSKVKQEN